MVEIFINMPLIFLLIIWTYITYQQLIVIPFNHLSFANINDKWITLYSSPNFLHFEKNKEYKFFLFPFFIIIKVPKIGNKINDNSFIILISKR